MKGETMKTAVQTISQESSRPYSDLACNPSNYIEIPHPTEHPIHVQQGQPIWWRAKYNFSISFTSGVFDSTSINAVPESDGHWYTRRLPVVGPSGNVTICT